MNKSYKTAESACAGHPDKLCDIIADSLLDACLRKDKSSRVACEVMATKGKIIVAGEITCDGKVDIRWKVCEVLRKVGYNPWKFTVFVFVHKQSKDIDAGGTTALEARNGSEERYGHFYSCLFRWEDYDKYKEIRKAAEKYADRKDSD
ncbi:hypothetical protein OBV_41650 [Oscillibacter valericigenes Sjm18-20]|nr:hypothetical protein OBV_41650 [Oscillibacter valericigenes Sjm18-20]